MSVDFTDRALADLAPIDGWLTRNGSPEIAENQLARLLNRARSLMEYPRRGPRLGAEARSMSVAATPYVLLYRVIDDGVQILRIRNNREDWHGA